MHAKFLVACAAAVLLVPAAIARPPQEKKLVEVKVCPITLETVKGKGGGETVYGKYRVHFCCADCKPAFAKLTNAQKDAKIQQALKKQQGAAGASSKDAVRICPMEMEAVHGEGAGSTTFEGRKVYFCCPGCKTAFDKLSNADKQKKVAAALKKQSESPAHAHH